jgi:hypothetical protein
MDYSNDRVVVVGCHVGIMISLFSTKGEKIKETRSDIPCTEFSRITVDILDNLIGIVLYYLGNNIILSTSYYI